MEGGRLFGDAAVNSESDVPPQPEPSQHTSLDPNRGCEGWQASGGGGVASGGGASSHGDDPETELRQVMRSSDFQQFCSLCQAQGQGDVFAVCRTFMEHRGQKRLKEFDEERQQVSSDTCSHTA